MKTRFHIEEYSFGQTTLEQVFIEMAKQQEAEDLDEADFAAKAKAKNSKDVMSMRRMQSRNEQVTELWYLGQVVRVGANVLFRRKHSTKLVLHSAHSALVW